MKNRGKAIGERNGLKIYTRLTTKKPLRSSTALKSHKKINSISAKQRERNKNWREITDKKCVDTGFICQWCGEYGKRDDDFNPLDGHHIKKRRYMIDTYENDFICHRLCHQFIEDNGIKVEVYSNKIAYDNRQK
jgi:hypothetical protein